MQKSKKIKLALPPLSVQKEHKTERLGSPGSLGANMCRLDLPQFFSFLLPLQKNISGLGIAVDLRHQRKTGLILL